MMKFLDYFFITRPILFFPGWATLFLGRWYGHSVMFSVEWGAFEFLLPGNDDFLLLAGFGMLMGGCFILNQIADIESDRLNSKLYFLHEGLITPLHAWIEAILLVIAGLYLLFAAGNKDLLIVGVIFALVTGYLYNFPPVKAKDKVVSGLVANMLMGESAFALGFLYEAPDMWQKMLFFSIPILALNTGLYVLTTLPDIGGDSKSNKKTIGAALGVERGIILGSVLIAVGIVGLPFDAPWSRIVFLLSVPPLMVMMLKRKLKNAVVALKLTIFGLALSAAYYWSWFAVLGIFMFFFTKFYFRKRFNTDYPNFSGD